MLLRNAAEAGSQLKSLMRKNQLLFPGWKHFIPMLGRRQWYQVLLTNQAGTGKDSFKDATRICSITTTFQIASCRWCSNQNVLLLIITLAIPFYPRLPFTCQWIMMSRPRFTMWAKPPNLRKVVSTNRRADTCYYTQLTLSILRPHTIL